MSTEKLVLEYKNASIVRGDHLILEHIDLEIAKGEFVYLTGAMGSGKSSLLKTIYADAPICADTALVCGLDLTKLKLRQVPLLRRQLGIIFQNAPLLEGHTIQDNLDIVLRAITPFSSKERKQRIEEVLSVVGMETKGYKKPHELSGGERQRIAIARANLGSPKLILADEPTLHLDQASALSIAELLHNLSREQGISVLMASHNAEVMRQYPARTLCLDHALEEVI